MQATRIAKGPPMNGDRGFKGRKRHDEERTKPSTYAVLVNGISTLRDISFPAAIISVRSLMRDIQGHKMVHPASLEALSPGEHTINVGAYSIKIQRYVAEPEPEDGVLRCGCIDVCRSNCDGRSNHW